MFDPEQLTDLQRAVLQGGLQIRCTEELLVDNESIARLVVHVFPLPAGQLVQELGLMIQTAIVQNLTDQGIIDGKITDMTARGPMQ